MKKKTLMTYPVTFGYNWTYLHCLYALCGLTQYFKRYRIFEVPSTWLFIQQAQYQDYLRLISEISSTYTALEILPYKIHRKLTRLPVRGQRTHTNAKTNKRAKSKNL